MVERQHIFCWTVILYNRRSYWINTLDRDLFTDKIRLYGIYCYGYRSGDFHTPDAPCRPGLPGLPGKPGRPGRPGLPCTPVTPKGPAGPVAPVIMQG